MAGPSLRSTTANPSLSKYVCAFVVSMNARRAPSACFPRLVLPVIWLTAGAAASGILARATFS
jgi:hypothetical protein